MINKGNKLPAYRYLLLKNLKFIIYTILMFFIYSGSSSSQDTLKSAPKISIGIDFFNVNSNWIYVNDYLYTQNGKDCRAKLIPSVFIRLPKNHYSFRIKSEFINNKYSCASIEGIKPQEISGTLNEGRILFGIEKYLKLNKIKVYPFLESGISISDFKGSYFMSFSPVIVSLQFDVRSFGICIQGGLGLRFQIIKDINLVIETSVLVDHGFVTNDNFSVYPENRFVLRPINLFGLDYSFN
jgi:hypothetical protein